MIDLAALTWTCMVCGAERRDQAISVAYRPMRGMEAQFPAARWNVRYCNDRPTRTAPGAADVDDAERDEESRRVQPAM